MLACLQSLPDQLIVVNGRRCNGHTFHFTVSQDFPHVGTGLHAILVPRGFQHLRAHITHSAQGTKLVKCTYHVLAPVTTTNNSDARTGHSLFLLFQVRGTMTKEMCNRVDDHLLLI